MYRHASSGAVLQESARPDREPAAVIARWDAAGRPPVPLVADAAGWVTVYARDVPGLFARRGRHWTLIQRIAANWIGRSCP
jgi:hypothetical protein